MKNFNQFPREIAVQSKWMLSLLLIAIIAGIASCTSRTDKLLESDNYDAVIDHAKILAQKGPNQRNLEKIETLLDHALSLRPKDSEALAAAGNLLLDLVHNSPNIEHPMLEHIIQQARPFFEKALALNPENTCNYGYIAICETTLGNHATAAAILARALELEPENQNLLVDYGIALYQTGRLDEAEKPLLAVTEGRQVDADSMNYVRANEYLSRIHRDRGNSTLADKTLEESIIAFERWKKAHGDSAEQGGSTCPYENMGVTYLTTNQEEQSVRRLHQAMGETSAQETPTSRETPE